MTLKEIYFSNFPFKIRQNLVFYINEPHTIRFINKEFDNISNGAKYRLFLRDDGLYFQSELKI